MIGPCLYLLRKSHFCILFNFILLKSLYIINSTTENYFRICLILSTMQGNCPRREVPCWCHKKERRDENHSGYPWSQTGWTEKPVGEIILTSITQCDFYFFTKRHKHLLFVCIAQWSEMGKQQFTPTDFLVRLRFSILIPNEKIISLKHLGIESTDRAN